jgi:hypothetical protein
VKRANIFFCVLFRFFFFGFDIARLLRISEQIKVTFQKKKKEVGNFHRETFCSESRQQQKKASTHLV